MDNNQMSSANHIIEHLKVKDIKICPYSGEAFKPTRRNSVFATSQNRMAFHNENAAALRLIKAPINKILDKNFLILSELIFEGETKVFPKDEILIKGFNPNYFTHFIEGENFRCIYHFVFSISVNSIKIMYPIKKDKLQRTKASVLDLLKTKKCR